MSESNRAMVQKSAAGKPATAQRDGFRDLLSAMIPRMAEVLPKHLTPERMVQIVAVEASRNPKLRECSTPSLAACVMLASELGLEPSGPLGMFYLIPRLMKGEVQCTALLGYKGYCELARRSGQIARLNASVVYRSEMEAGHFSATNEPPSIHHGWSPDVEHKDSDIVAAYATVELTGGGRAQVILTRADIEARRKRSSAGGSGPWSTDFAQMCRKTALRALLSGGLVPLSAEMAKAVENDADRPEIIETTATESHRQAVRGENALANALLTAPAHAAQEAPTKPDPSPMAQQVLAMAERLANRDQGVVPEWLPDGEAILALDDSKLSALLDRLDGALAAKPANGALPL